MLLGTRLWYLFLMEHSDEQFEDTLAQMCREIGPPRKTKLTLKTVAKSVAALSPTASSAPPAPASAPAASAPAASAPVPALALASAPPRAPESVGGRGVEIQPHTQAFQPQVATVALSEGYYLQLERERAAAAQAEREWQQARDRDAQREREREREADAAARETRYMYMYATTVTVTVAAVACAMIVTKGAR